MGGLCPKAERTQGDGVQLLDVAHVPYSGIPLLLNTADSAALLGRKDLFLFQAKAEKLKIDCE